MKEKIFMSAYWQSIGIVEAEGEICEGGGYSVNLGTGLFNRWIPDCYAFKTREEAIIDAERQRNRKISYLRDKIRGLEKIKIK